MTIIRLLAIVTGGLTLAWQAYLTANGEMERMFVIADVLAGGFLVLSGFIRPDSLAQKLLPAAFGWMGGVYLVATFGSLMTGAYTFGPMSTTLGLVSCVLCTWLLMRRG